MGGEGSGRKPDVVKSMREQQRTPIASAGTEGIYLPALKGVKRHIKDVAHGITTDDLTEGSTNLYYDTSDVDARIATHTADDDAHHAKYTDAEAVSAVSTADDYLKNDGDTATGDYNFDSNTLFIDSSENSVGIGTTNPGRNLEIAGPSSAGLSLNSTNYNTYSLFSWTSADKFSIYDETDTAHRLVIDGDGNVGIGTTSPTGLLQLRSSTPILYITADDTNQSTIYMGGVSNKNAGRIIYSDNADWMKLYINDAEALHIDASQKVGIGTSSPNESLTVEAGVVSIKETTTPTATTNYGKVYTKTDNKLYFQDGAGTEHEIAFV